MSNNTEYIRGKEETQEEYEQKVYNAIEKVDSLRVSIIAEFADIEGIDEEVLLELDDVFDEIKNDLLGIIQGGAAYEE